MKASLEFMGPFSFSFFRFGVGVDMVSATISTMLVPMLGFVLIVIGIIVAQLKNPRLR